MGNREALLQGAKSCLLEKGFANTTARDIASAGGVSLAAIGYHFRSKEALLTEAFFLAIEDWEKEFRQALNTAVSPDAGPVERFESTWTQLIKTFQTHRPLWAANFELFAQLENFKEIQRVLGNSLQQARSGLASLLLHREERSIDKETARVMGGFYHALMSGLIAQFLIDPEHALSARELTHALQVTAASLASPKGAPTKKRSGPPKKAGARKAVRRKSS
jgi:AcrR family transcriptional regulator